MDAFLGSGDDYWEGRGDGVFVVLCVVIWSCSSAGEGGKSIDGFLC